MAVRLAAAVVCVAVVAGCTSAATTSPQVITSSASSRSSSSSAAPATSALPSSSSANTRRPTPTPTPSRGNAPLVVLNPGHNGGNATHTAEIARLVPAGFGRTKACDTTGTDTVSGYPEHAFNWDVTLRVRTILQAHGVRVLLTRSSDTGVGPCVDQRAAIGNEPGVAATVSIHADGTSDGVGHGFHVCEDSRQPAGASIAARSHALTVAVHDALVRGSGLVPSTYIGTNGYYPRDDLAGLNLATGPATFLELGNMRNAGDAALLTSTSGRQRIAAAVAAGILAFLGY